MEVYTDWLLANRSTVSLVDRKIVSDLTDDVVKTGTPLADFTRTYTSWLKQEVFDATFWDWVSTNRSAFGFTTAQLTSLRSGFAVNIDDPTNPTLTLRNFSNQAALRKLNDAVDSAFGDTSTFRALVPQPIDDDAPWITGRRTALEPRSYVNGFNFNDLPFVNDAPVLNAAGTPTGVTVEEDSSGPAGPVGTLISSLVDFATPAGQVDNVTDADAGALLGIAVIAAPTTNGTWFYSTNNGANWISLRDASDSSARLLAADGNTRIYFQGAANFDGQADLTFRAWDRTSGSNGQSASTVINGGRTAFSTATDTATFDITPVNDAPKAVHDTAQIREDTSPNPITGNVLLNDSDADGDLLLTITAGTFTSDYGTLLIDANGAYTYTLNNDNETVNGLNDGDTLKDTFSYSISDDHGGTASATLVITIEGKNEPNLLAVAFTDKNANHTYEAATDLLIVALLDTNGDGVVSAGDTVKWGTYPTSLDDSTARGTFTAPDDTLTSYNVADSTLISIYTVSSGGSTAVQWRQVADLENIYVGGNPNHLIVDSFIATDTIGVINLVSYGKPDTLVGIVTSNQPGNQGFIDVAIFI